MNAYAAFLRGVSPLNLKMPVLKAALEAVNFVNVKTLLSSGNVVFQTRLSTETAVETKVEAALIDHVGRPFYTIARSVNALREMVASQPHAAFKPRAEAKLVVTFLRDKPKQRPVLPLERDGVRLLAMTDREVFSDYVVGPAGPVFMTLLEKTFGKNITTRTWDTVAKVVAAGDKFCS